MKPFSTDSTRTTTAAPTQGDLVRVTVVAVSTLVAFVAGFLGSGAVIGTPIDEAAGGALSASATLVAPAGPAFAIWGVIYTGLVALAVYQALPGQRSDLRQRRTGWWVAASSLLNAAWILAAQAGSVGGALAVIAALLVVLVIVVFRLGAARSTSPLQSVLLDGVLGLYLGWVAVATVANTAAALVTDAGWRATGPTATALAVIGLLVTAAGTYAIARLLGARFSTAASLAWGLAFIAVARSSGDLRSTPVAVAAVLAAAVAIVSPFVVRWRQRTPARAA